MWSKEHTKRVSESMGNSANKEARKCHCGTKPKQSLKARFLAYLGITSEEQYGGHYGY